MAKDTPKIIPDSVQVQESPVAPVESVETAPTEDTREKCWNCDGKLDDEGVCSKCGFDKSKLHNLNLEAERAAKKQREAQAAQPTNK